MFLALFTLIYAGSRRNLVSSGLLADIENAKSSFENDDDVEDTINIMEVPRRRISWKQCGVYKGHRSPAQYLFLDGKCQHIQSWNTVYNLYGRNVYRTISQSDMNSCRKTHSIRGRAWLARGRGSHPVYVIFNGRKHHVSSPRTMSRCRFRWSKVRVVPRWFLNRYANGRTIRA